MRRDMDLCREILRQIADSPTLGDPVKVAVEGRWGYLFWGSRLTRQRAGARGLPRHWAKSRGGSRLPQREIALVPVEDKEPGDSTSAAQAPAYSGAAAH